MQRVPRSKLAMAGMIALAAANTTAKPARSSEEDHPLLTKLRPSPPKPEGEATPEQKQITLAGRRGKGTRRQRRNRRV